MKGAFLCWSELIPMPNQNQRNCTPLTEGGSLPDERYDAAYVLPSFRASLLLRQSVRPVVENRQHGENRGKKRRIFLL